MSAPIPLPSNAIPSPLFALPCAVSSPSSITSLAVYGTLRDDDDSGAPWTAAFIADRRAAFSGLVRGVRLYHITELHYPCAIITDDVQHHIHVRVLQWDAATFPAKLREADLIEGYREDDEEASEYVRRKVEVEVTGREGGGGGSGGEGSGVVLSAWIYIAKQLERFGSVEELPHGDWMRRRRRKGERTAVSGAWSRANDGAAV